MENQGLTYLNNLNRFLNTIDNNLYTNKFENFPFTGTIGAHCRHIIEFYTQFLDYYETEAIDYDGRKRNLLLETDILVAQKSLTELILVLSNTNFNYNATLNLTNNGVIAITTIGREINYLAEHNVHHLAIIRILAESIAYSFIDIPHFGVAISTQGHRTSEN